MSSKFLYTAKVTWRQRLSESAGMGGYPIFRLTIKNAVKQGCFHIPPSRTAMLNVGCWLDVGYCLSLHGGQHLPKLLAADFQWLLNSLQLATACGNLANVLPNAMDSNDSNDSNDGFQCIAMDFNGLQWIPCSVKKLQIISSSPSPEVCRSPACSRRQTSKHSPTASSALISVYLKVGYPKIQWLTI